MKIKLLLAFLLLHVCVYARTAEDLGFRHIRYLYKGDTVDILVRSKKGEELVKKPLFFFCQGSLPKPLIKYSDRGDYPVFPFDTDSLEQQYHLVIVGKPYIPLAADTKTLGPEFTYVDSTGHYPKAYSDRNLLSYYADRNIAVIGYLQQQSWVSPSRLVAAGHSEGSTVAARMASLSAVITHLIYSGGNPLGRIMAVITQNRMVETDSARYGEQSMAYWQAVVAHKDELTNDGQGDTYKATYEFSLPPLDYMSGLKIPVLVSYGTKDYSAGANDYLQTYCILHQKNNFRFHAYIGTEHNYFPLNKDNQPDFEVYNWNKVAGDWLDWLNHH